MAAGTQAMPAAVLERAGHALTTIVDPELRGCYVTTVEPSFAPDGMASSILAAAGAILTEDAEGHGIDRVIFTDRYAANFVNSQGAIGETALMQGLSERIGDAILDQEMAVAA